MEKYVCFLEKNPIIYYFLQFTYGIIMNIIGGLLALILLITGYKPKKFTNNIYFEFKKIDWFGFSCGIFVFIGKDCTNFLWHESGHSIQNVTFGPLFPFIVAIPSVIRFWYRELKFYKKGLTPKTYYDDIWFEGQATLLGSYIIYYRKD